MKNKRGDIPITILVIGIIALCGIALLSFYLVQKKEANKIDLVFYLQHVYNEVESFKYSLATFPNVGEDSIRNWYGIEKGNNFVIKRNYAPKGPWAWSKKGEPLINVTYTFTP
tara:strand:- start:487 stop:825 length:339 start_codon:yes stop_codon:yes gene_type:complete